MLNPWYVVGFTDGEGCFSVTVNKRNQIIPEIRLIFEIELREDDRQILHYIQEILQCGKIYHLDYERYNKWKPHVKLKVSNFRDIFEKIIPFFKKYPLQAKKKISFGVFCEVAKMIKSKKHLTTEGIEEIKFLKESLKI
jgi:LAGLIDADG endonuclease